MSYSYTGHICDDEGYVLSEVEVSYEAEPNSDLSGIDVLSITVTRYMRSGRGWERTTDADLLRPDVGSLAYAMGLAFKDQIESDPDEVAQVFEDHCIRSTGGSSDPDARLVRAA